MSNLKKEIINNFNEKFSNSNFWVDSNNYPKNYVSIRKFLKETIKIVEEKTEVYCEEQYRLFIKEVRQQAKEEMSE